jgi:threonine aldolase
MCELLGERLAGLDQIEITMPPVVNALFCISPKDITQPLMDKYHFYMWNEALNEVRLMCSLNTREEHIGEFVEDVTDLQQQ